jgi:hypothetical protein
MKQPSTAITELLGYLLLISRKPRQGPELGILLAFIQVCPIKK